MIKIGTNNIDNIVSVFYQAIEPYLSIRLNFVIDLFEHLTHNDCDLTLLKNTHKLPLNIILPIIKPLLKEENKKQKLSVLLNKQDIFDDNKFNIDGSLIFFKNVRNDLKSIIIGNPKEIYQLAKRNDFNKQNNDIIKEILEKIFNYEKLTGSGFKLRNKKLFNSYTLTSMLGLSVCPYCNRNWIITVSKNGEKITNPQLDHFFSKTDFPILRLSFYNLIPSCETCNARLKKDKEFKINENLHPYLNGYSNNAKFRVSPKSYEAAIGTKTDYKIELDYLNEKLETKIKVNHEIFKINEIYEKNGDIISEIYRKKYIWNEKYLEILKNTFNNLNISKKEMYRLLLGNYIDENDFVKRPFSLITRDITKELNMT